MPRYTIIVYDSETLTEKRYTADEIKVSVLVACVPAILKMSSRSVRQIESGPSAMLEARVAALEKSVFRTGHHRPNIDATQ